MVSASLSGTGGGGLMEVGSILVSKVSNMHYLIVSRYIFDNNKHVMKNFDKMSLKYSSPPPPSGKGSWEALLMTFLSLL